MRSEKLNREVTLTPEERADLSDKLIKAGIDRKDVAALLGEVGIRGKGCTKTDNCCHAGGHGQCPEKCKHENCDKFFRVDPKAMDQLLEIMKRKKIDPRALGKVASKIVK